MEYLGREGQEWGGQGDGRQCYAGTPDLRPETTVVAKGEAACKAKVLEACYEFQTHRLH